MSVFARVTTAALIAIIACASGLMSVFDQGARAGEAVLRKPDRVIAFFLSGVNGEKTAEIASILARHTDAPGSAIARVDQELSPVDGSPSGTRIGVQGDPRGVSELLSAQVNGTRLISEADISALLTAEPSKSIGLDANSVDVIAEPPSWEFSPDLVVVQLGRLLERSNTPSGMYWFVSSDSAAATRLLEELGSLTHQTVDQMLVEQRGMESDRGLATIVVLSLGAAATILLLLLLVIETVKARRALGVDLLVGRTRAGFALVLLRPVFVAGAAGAAISFTLTLACAHGFQFNVELLAVATFASLAGTIPVLLCAAISAAIVSATRPVDAIRGRYSRRPMLLALTGVYIVTMVGTSTAFVAMDAPMSESRTLTEVGRAWSGVQDQRILYRESPGSDHAGLADPNSQHAQDFYNWYREIAQQPGVSIVNSQRYTEEQLAQWGDAYESVPEEPFWFLAASPSYLASQDFPVSQDVLARASRGERVFLLPNSLSDSATGSLSRWLEEDSRVDGPPSIRTEYFGNPVVHFESYSPSQPLFLWNSNPHGAQRATDPVILVLTPQNLIPFESESLSAIGLENSYVKLAPQAAEQYTDRGFLANYGLDDNAPEFRPVSEFIAGLTKTIQEFVTLFGIIAAFLGILSVIVIVSLAQLFASIYRDVLTVKRTLGFPLIHLFGPLFAMVGSVGLIAIGVMIGLRSQAGFFGTAILVIIQALLIVGLLARYARLPLASALKELDGS